MVFDKYTYMGEKKQLKIILLKIQNLKIFLLLDTFYQLKFNILLFINLKQYQFKLILLYNFNSSIMDLVGYIIYFMIFKESKIIVMTYYYLMKILSFSLFYLMKIIQNKTFVILQKVHVNNIYFYF